jgi:hypothetical protein
MAVADWTLVEDDIQRQPLPKMNPWHYMTRVTPSNSGFLLPFFRCDARFEVHLIGPALQGFPEPGNKIRSMLVSHPGLEQSRQRQS